LDGRSSSQIDAQPFAKPARKSSLLSVHEEEVDYQHYWNEEDQQQQEAFKASYLSYGQHVLSQVFRKDGEYVLRLGDGRRVPVIWEVQRTPSAVYQRLTSGLYFRPDPKPRTRPDQT